MKSAPLDTTGEGAAAALPARGRKMNSNPVSSPLPKIPTPQATKAPPKANDAKSAASGWGNVSRGPWGGSSVGSPSVRGDDDKDDRKSVASSTSGWGNVSRGPWGGSSVGGRSVRGNDDDGKSVASSTSGWGNVSRGPWGGSSIGSPSVRGGEDDDEEDTRTVNGSPRAVNRSWAEEMDDEFPDNRSVVASSASGWGTISNGPW
jgi:hypothetical protein